MPEPPGSAASVAGACRERAHARIAKLDLSRSAPRRASSRCSPPRTFPARTMSARWFRRRSGVRRRRWSNMPARSLFAVAADSLDGARAAARLAVVEYEDLPALPHHRRGGAARLAASCCRPSHAPRRCRRGASPRRRTPQGPARIGGQDHFYLEGQVALAVPRRGRRHADPFLDPASDRGAASGRPCAGTARQRRHRRGAPHGRRLRRQGDPGGAVRRRRGAGRGKTGRPVKVPPRPRRRHDHDRQAPRFPHRLRSRLRRRRAASSASSSMLAVALRLFRRSVAARSTTAPCSMPTTAISSRTSTIVSHRCKTHTVSNTAFRGFGGPQGMMGIERVMDDIARHLGQDPLAVRKLNLYGKAERNITPYHQTVEDNIAPELIAELETSAGLRRAAPRDRRLQRRRAAAEARPRADAGQVRHLLHHHPSQPGRRAGACLYRRQRASEPRRHRDGPGAVHQGGAGGGRGVRRSTSTGSRSPPPRTDKVPNTSATAASSGTDLNGKAAQAAARIHQAAAGRVRGRAVRRARPARSSSAGTGARRRRGDALRRAGQATPIWRGSRSRPPAITRRRRSTTTAAPHRGRPFYYFAYGAAVSEVRDRHADRREQGAPRRHPARRRQVAESGDRPRPDRGRLHPGHGLADHRGAGVGRKGRLRTHAPSTYKIPACGDRPADFRRDA